MKLEEKLQRSKSAERIDFSKYQSIDKQDPLLKITPGKKILVEPCWTIPGDFEGGMYADYIAGHPEYDGIYIRSGLLKKLEPAANALAEPYQLVIRAGHRPIEVQRRLLRECATDYKRDNPGVTDEQKANRSLLVTTMLSAGLASCKPEWWHFSYGDQVVYSEQNSLYSPIDI